MNIAIQWLVMEELKNSINFVGRGKADPSSLNNFENRGITTVKRTSMAKPPTDVRIAG